MSSFKVLKLKGDYSQYKKDKSKAYKTETEISGKLLKFYGWKTIRFNNTYHYDLLIKKSKRVITVEIKEDFSCERTGNIGIEYWSRGKFTGISITESQYYIIKAHRPNEIVFLLIKTTDLKELIKNKEYTRIVIGGDKDSGSTNYLFKYETILKKSKVLFDKSNGAMV